MTDFRMHGANPEKTYRFFSIPIPEKIYDFSTNTNVLPWEKDLEIDVQKAMSEYPDDESEELRLIIAKENNCHSDNVLVTNGSNEAIYLIASYQEDVQNCIVQPVYGEYARALEAFGAPVRNISSLSQIGEGDVSVWICNPNNPTGEYRSEKVMTSLFNRFKNTIFVIDEAYRDFLYNGRWELKIRDFANVIVLRSLTKSYHLCGARIGYVLADKKIIRYLKRRQPTWSVNSIAQAAAAVYMSDDKYLKRTKEFYRREVDRFINELEKLGYEITPTSVNFFIVKIDDDEKLIRFLLERGIVVRHTRNFMGLNGKYVRVAARTVEENNIFIEAMKEYDKK